FVDAVVTQSNLPNINVLSIELKEGLKAHKEKRRDPIAKYWKAYYLKEGFKEAANENVPDAQLHYAFAKLAANNVDDFIIYLEKAAALFNYGDMLLNGKHGIMKDEKKRNSIFKIAAVKGHPKAIEELRNRKIEYISIYNRGRHDQ
ncbi:8073_t:CDS:2, partial [Racocetra persica]